MLKSSLMLLLCSKNLPKVKRELAKLVLVKSRTSLARKSIPRKSRSRTPGKRRRPMSTRKNSRRSKLREKLKVSKFKFLNAPRVKMTLVLKLNAQVLVTVPWVNTQEKDIAPV